MGLGGVLDAVVDVVDDDSEALDDAVTGLAEELEAAGLSLFEQPTSVHAANTSATTEAARVGIGPT